LRELLWFAASIPELIRTGERPTALPYVIAGSTDRDGARPCVANLQTTGNLSQVALSLKVVDGFVEVTFQSLRKYVRG
ncbi:hypothetical protein ABTD78_25170, partial [Acinetobacter baumannii]